MRAQAAERHGLDVGLPRQLLVGKPLEQLARGRDFMIEFGQQRVFDHWFALILREHGEMTRMRHEETKTRRKQATRNARVTVLRTLSHLLVVLVAGCGRSEER